MFLFSMLFMVCSTALFPAAGNSTDLISALSVLKTAAESRPLSSEQRKDFECGFNALQIFACVSKINVIQNEKISDDRIVFALQSCREIGPDLCGEIFEDVYALFKNSFGLGIVAARNIGARHRVEQKLLELFFENSESEVVSSSSSASLAAPITQNRLSGASGVVSQIRALPSELQIALNIFSSLERASQSDLRQKKAYAELARATSRIMRLFDPTCKPVPVITHYKKTTDLKKSSDFALRYLKVGLDEAWNIPGKTNVKDCAIQANKAYKNLQDPLTKEPLTIKHFVKPGCSVDYEEEWSSSSSSSSCSSSNLEPKRGCDEITGYGKKISDYFYSRSNKHEEIEISDEDVAESQVKFSRHD